MHVGSAANSGRVSIPSWPDFHLIHVHALVLHTCTCTNLLFISSRVGQQCRDMEHNLVTLKHSKHTSSTSCISCTYMHTHILIYTNCIHIVLGVGRKEGNPKHVAQRSTRHTCTCIAHRPEKHKHIYTVMCMSYWLSTLLSWIFSLQPTKLPSVLLKRGLCI